MLATLRSNTDPSSSPAKRSSMVDDNEPGRWLHNRKVDGNSALTDVVVGGLSGKLE